MRSVLKKTKANVSIVQRNSFIFFFELIQVMDGRINQNAHVGAHAQHKRKNRTKITNKTKVYYINKNDIYYRQGID